MLKENDRLSTLKLPIARLLLLLVVFFLMARKTKDHYFRSHRWPATQRHADRQHFLFANQNDLVCCVCVCLGGGRVLLDGSSMYVDR